MRALKQWLHCAAGMDVPPQCPQHANSTVPTDKRIRFPRTKFQPPRLRADTLPRERLVDAIEAGASNCRVTLLSAPAGFGKSTLLAQVAARLERVAWVSLDPEDDQGERFVASLVEALSPFGMHWDVDPQAMVATLGADGAQMRSAMGLIVNALCTAEATRIHLVIDDFHRLNGRNNLRALDYLVERLPEHVSLLLGTRLLAPVSFARLRARGQLAEFGAQDLAFTRDEVQELMGHRPKSIAIEANAQAVTDATQGWPAGVVLMLQALGSVHGADALARIQTKRPTEIFDFLAAEVLGALQPDVRDFILACSVLEDLRPETCMAVSGRRDAAALLDSLYRSNVFVTVIDDAAPVMKFHELFREFLLHQLQQSDQSGLAALHRRAAEAEVNTLRAIGHLISAGAWDDAAEAISSKGMQMLVESQSRDLSRLIEGLPRGVREKYADTLFLSGVAAWSRWDMKAAKANLRHAAYVYALAGDSRGRARSLFALVPPLYTTGEIEEAAKVLAECEEHAQASADDRALIPVLRMWLAIAGGDAQRVSVEISRILELASSAEAGILLRRYAWTGGGVHGYVAGFPQCGRYFSQLAAAVVGTSLGRQYPALEAMTCDLMAWASLWEGRLPDACASAVRSVQVNEDAGGLIGPGVDADHLSALLHAVQGEEDAALAAIDAIVQRLQHSQGFAATWLGPYSHLKERVRWILGRRQSVPTLARAVVAPASAAEWPFMQGARELSRAYAAVDEERWVDAIALAERAVGVQRLYPMPAFCSDARVCLAYAQLRRGDPQGAWTTFRPVVADALGERGFGLLLYDNPTIVACLLDLGVRHGDAVAGLNHLAQRHQEATGRARTANPAASRSVELTPREWQVLELVAEGASNKRIANDLFLSVHTVKRHMANIIAKLGASTRGEAAAFFHASSKTARTDSQAR